MEDETLIAETTVGNEAGADANQEPVSEGQRQLVTKLSDRIKEDKRHHKPAFDTMREDMMIARVGAGKDWPKSHYKANITGRLVNQKVTALYAKNPKAVAKRRERLDFAVWDESETSLIQAMQTAQMGQAAGVDPMTGAPRAVADPMFQQATALLQDFEQGMRSRENARRIGKTLELLFDYFTKEQSPVDFKTSMKQLVRRTLTTGVGYVTLGFQRDLEQRPQVAERLADFRGQLAYAARLIEETENGKDPEQEVKQAELEAAIKSLEEQEYVLAREGLVFDFPDATRVIPDRMTKNLTGFIGARWLTQEFLFTPEEVKEIFDVDLGKEFTEYSLKGSTKNQTDGPISEPEAMESSSEEGETSGLACVWAHYDRQSGTVYYLCDGHHSFLREPGAPDVYVEDFWPVFALVFNEVEDESNLFPPSDVRLIKDMQDEYNRARQGKREHRQAARPRFGTPKGMLDDEDKTNLTSAEPFTVTELNVPPDTDIRTVLQNIPVPGVDPNLYETGETMTDVQLVAGAQEAQFGAVAKATATESSIAESSRVASVDSNIDDLDGFMTRIARASGQVLLREMSEEQVKEIVGPGALWPQLTLEQIAKEVFLEVEAGSSGRPNQAQEIRNWQQMLPYLLQLQGINGTWLARETLYRLDDKLDLTEAITEGLPSVMALNGMHQTAPSDPANAPDAQGGEGANNGPAAPGGPTGTDAPMGNNQV